jgi:hypothetical protein
LYRGGGIPAPADAKANGAIAVRPTASRLISCFNSGSNEVQRPRVVPLAGRRDQLGAVLRLTESGSEALAGFGRATFARRLREHMQQRFEAVTVPRKWRYVGALPVNAMGKTTQAALAWDILKVGAVACLSPFLTVGTGTETDQRCVDERILRRRQGEAARHGVLSSGEVDHRAAA